MPRPLRTLLPAAAALATVALTGPAAFAAPASGTYPPIGPDEPFAAAGPSVTYTVRCALPPTPGETGTPAANQDLYVVPAILGTPVRGFTGANANHLDAVFSFTSMPSETVEIDYYFLSVPLPSTLRLPCSGSGVLTFVPLPTASNAQSETASVTYTTAG